MKTKEEIDRLIMEDYQGRPYALLIAVIIGFLLIAVPSWIIWQFGLLINRIKHLTLMLILMIFISPGILAPESHAVTLVEQSAINPYIELYQATCVVESNNNASAINYAEQAHGIVQIRQCKLNEYYRATGIRYSLKDCHREGVSKEIFMWHCMKYIDIELSARRWNGSGPLTDKYWMKIKKQLKIE